MPWAGTTPGAPASCCCNARRLPAIIDHTADFGIRVWGEDARRLFEQAAMALKDLLFGETAVASDRTEVLEIGGLDWPDLMVNWLRELLYLWAGREQVLAGVRIDTITETGLKASVTSARFDPVKHHLNHEIKAVTYHGINVRETGKGWEAQVILDA